MGRIRGIRARYTKARMVASQLRLFTRLVCSSGWAHSDAAEVEDYANTVFRPRWLRISAFLLPCHRRIHHRFASIEVVEEKWVDLPCLAVTQEDANRILPVYFRRVEYEPAVELMRLWVEPTSWR
jgi:hypothetical protein